MLIYFRTIKLGYITLTINYKLFILNSYVFKRTKNLTLKKYILHKLKMFRSIYKAKRNLCIS